jgi:uncharacterized RDD family membrane protein YckC
MAINSNPPIDLTYLIMRITAFIIDILILVVVIVAVAILADISMATFAIIAFLPLLYYIILDVYLGGTIGRKIVGLQVQLEKGGKITLKHSLIRNLSKFFVFPVFLDWLIAAITSGADRRQNCLDRMAGTTVVQTRQISQSTVPPPPPT